MSGIANYVLYLQQIGFCQVAGAAALFYDYLLGLGSEVDLIWTKKWNLVTLLYAVVRYLSFLLLIDGAFYTGNVNWTAQQCLVWYQIRIWGMYIYRIAMDVIMMKRIWALSLNPGPFFKCSKWVAIVMVVGWIAKSAAAFVLLMLGIGPGRQLSTLEAEFAGTYVCGTMIPNSGFLMSSAIPTFCFELFLCVLAVGYCGAGVWEHYRSEKRWKVNELVKILARDSIIYFALILAAAALNIGNWQVSAPSSFMALSMSLQTFIPFYFSPRLVINVKQRNNRVHMSIIEHDLLVHNIPMGIHAQDGPPLG